MVIALALLLLHELALFFPGFLGAITLKFATDAKGKPAMTTFRQQNLRYWIDQPQPVAGKDTGANPGLIANE